MPTNVVKTARDEALWEAAKRAAQKGDYEGDSLWKVVMHIFQNMKHSGKEARDAQENHKMEALDFVFKR